MVLFILVATATRSIVNLSNNRLFAILATVAVLMTTVIGFWLLGSPQKQRQIRLDQQRLQDLYQIAQSLHRQAQQSLNRDEPVNLPKTLSTTLPKTDPVSGNAYEYQQLDSTRYQLCAEFATDSETYRFRNEAASNPEFWKHSAGRDCFEVNVLEEPPRP